MARREKSAFALRLRTLRKKHGMTQGDVAQRLNMHRTTYTKYETDRTHVDQVYLVALAELFRVSVDFLLGKEEGDVSLVESTVTDEIADVQEQELLTLFRRLTEEQRQQLLNQSRHFVMQEEQTD